MLFSASLLFVPFPCVDVCNRYFIWLLRFDRDENLHSSIESPNKNQIRVPTINVSFSHPNPVRLSIIIFRFSTQYYRFAFTDKKKRHRTFSIDYTISQLDECRLSHYATSIINHPAFATLAERTKKDINSLFTRETKKNVATKWSAAESEWAHEEKKKNKRANERCEYDNANNNHLKKKQKFMIILRTFCLCVRAREARTTQAKRRRFSHK